MTSGGKIILIFGFLGLTGLGLYLFLKSKKNNSTNSAPVGSTSLTQSSLPSQTNSSSSATVSAPSNQSGSSASTNKPPIPLPSDLSADELQAVKNFCNLAEGRVFSAFTPFSNFDLNTKWGLVNSFYMKHFKGNISMSMKDYFDGLNKYLGCS